MFSFYVYFSSRGIRMHTHQHHKAIQVPSLYVGNLSTQVTQPLLYEIFAAVGPVTSAKIITDKVVRTEIARWTRIFGVKLSSCFPWLLCHSTLLLLSEDSPCVPGCSTLHSKLFLASEHFRRFSLDWRLGRCVPLVSYAAFAFSGDISLLCVLLF